MFLDPVLLCMYPLEQTAPVYVLVTDVLYIFGGFTVFMTGSLFTLLRVKQTLVVIATGQLYIVLYSGTSDKHTPNKEHLSIKDKSTRPYSYYTSTF